MKVLRCIGDVQYTTRPSQKLDTTITEKVIESSRTFFCPNSKGKIKSFVYCNLSFKFSKIS